MNKFIIAFFALQTVILSSFILISATFSEQNSYVPVGTVIYSVLEPNVFLKNNKDWRLLDGSKIETNSQLSKMTNDQELPDTRGVFIRSSNINGIGKDFFDRKPKTFQDWATAMPSSNMKFLDNHRHQLLVFGGGGYFNERMQPPKPNFNESEIFETVIISKDNKSNRNLNNALLTVSGRFNYENLKDNIPKDNLPNNINLGNNHQFKYFLRNLPGNPNVDNWQTHATGGDKETRPINISLYTYVKIN